MVKRKEAVPINEERVELVFKDGKSKGHRFSNVQGENSDEKDNIQGTGKQKCRYD